MKLSNNFPIKFGSKDSLDDDYCFIVDKIGTISECKAFCGKIESDYPIEINSNLIVIKDGIVVDCYKGTPDEVNNSIYHTFHLHKQEIFPNPVEREMERNIDVKIERACRIICSFLSRTENRADVKIALKNGYPSTLGIIKRTNFTFITDFNKNNARTIDIHKTIMFQMVQVLCLLSGFEIYTKKKCAIYYPTCSGIIYRLENPMNGYILEAYKKYFVKQIKIYNNGEN